MPKDAPSTRPVWSGCSTPRAASTSRRASSNTSGTVSRVHPPIGPGLILPGGGAAPASTGPRSATIPSPRSCAAIPRRSSSLPSTSPSDGPGRLWPRKSAHFWMSFRDPLCTMPPVPGRQSENSRRSQPTTSSRASRWSGVSGSTSVSAIGGHADATDTTATHLTPSTNPRAGRLTDDRGERRSDRDPGPLERGPADRPPQRQPRHAPRPPPARGVGARMRAGLRASNRRARHLPMRYETGLPSSVIRFRT